MQNTPFSQFPGRSNIAFSTTTPTSAPTSPPLDTPANRQMAPIATAPAAAVEKNKRQTACLVCRKRKLKCDSTRPKCASCTRLGHACGYEETRKKSGPKQGYVKKLEQKSQTLEQRLAQLERLLATHQSQQAAMSHTNNAPLPTPPGISPLPFENISLSAPAATDALNQFKLPTNNLNSFAPNMFSNQPVFPDLSPADNSSNINLNAFPLFSNDASPINDQQAQGVTDVNPLGGQWAWDLISLGMNEEFPPEELTNKCVEAYFSKCHGMMPFLHRARFMAACQLPPAIGAPACLRYIVWALGASASTDQNLRSYKELFYTRSRRALTDTLETTLDTFKPHRISTLQTLILCATYEFLHGNFGHAWMNTGRAARMCVFFNLLRLDELHLFCKQTLAETRDWVDHEERRRTFWSAFMLDRFASLGTGWASAFTEEDITTFLPCPDDEYQAGTGDLGENTGESLYPSTKASSNRKPIGSMGAIVRITAFLGRLNIHVNRPNQEKDYITRHRELDNLLATIQYSIPDYLKYVPGSSNTQAAFLQNLTSVASVLLNQAALYKSQLTELPLRLSDLASRCHMGAIEIANTVRGISHVHVTLQCAYTAFCIYVGARVFVEMLRQPAPATPPTTGPTRDALQGDLSLMLTALKTFTEHVPLAGHFLMQLEADLNGLEKVISVRPYDVTVGFDECHILHGVSKPSEPRQSACSRMAAGDHETASNPLLQSNWAGQRISHSHSSTSGSFDMHAAARFQYVDTSRSNSLANDTTPTMSASSVNPLSSDSSPNIATPDSIRQFDPDKYFNDINMGGGNTMDISMNVGQGINDDGSVEFFTEMLGVSLNGS